VALHVPVHANSAHPCLWHDLARYACSSRLGSSSVIPDGSGGYCRSPKLRAEARRRAGRQHGSGVARTVAVGGGLIALKKLHSGRSDTAAIMPHRWNAPITAGQRRVRSSGTPQGPCSSPYRDASTVAPDAGDVQVSGHGRQQGRGRRISPASVAHSGPGPSSK
jgi:hypothetical protein